MSKVTIVLTSGTTWTVPIDCTSATVEVVGGCDFFGSGNGGGYSKTNNVSLTPLQKVYIQIGFLTTLTWFNKDTNSAPTYTANGASASQSSSSGIGDIKYSGGLSPTPTTFAIAPGCCSYYYIYGGAGGQAGPNGNGANGGSATAVGDNTFGGGGGGGGANGGTVGSNAGNSPYGGGAGGNSFFGLGGIGQTASISATSGTNGSGGGGSYATSTSSPGTAGNGSLSYFWTDSYSKISYGVSGGPGGSVNSTTSSTNNFFGGSYAVNTGMTAGFGFIVITYTPTSPQTGTYVEAITNNSPAGWKVPAGVTSLKIECIGAGSSSSDIFSTIYPANTASSGGSYASNTVTVIPNDFLKIQVGVPQYANYQDSNTPGSTVVRTSSNTVLVCATGGVSGALPNNANNVGSITFVGGVGGNNAYASTRGYSAGGGGGGAAGPGGAGKAGGNANATATAGRGGGGGGAGGTSSTAGGNATGTVAGAGGAGPAGTGAGSAATSGANAGAGTNGGGGGGGFSSTTATRYDGAAGGANTISTWTTSVQNATYGPGGGGGGAACIVGLPPYPSGGSGGLYGGGVGGGFSSGGGGGLIILTYTVTAANNISSPEMTPMFFR
jgi:hypothetical protein